MKRTSLPLQRREFIALLGGFVVPIRATAQHAPRLPRIGNPSRRCSLPVCSESLSGELRDLGYVPKQNIAFEMRNAEGIGHRLAALADELVDFRLICVISSGQHAGGSGSQKGLSDNSDRHDASRKTPLSSDL